MPATPSVATVQESEYLAMLERAKGLEPSTFSLGSGTPWAGMASRGVHGVLLLHSLDGSGRATRALLSF